MLYKKALFIFRRDLRTHDNTALNQALKKSASVIPCFIFDDQQIGKNNAYRSMNAIHFMVESLKDLQQQLIQHQAKLYIFHGPPAQVIEQLRKQELIDALFFNRDYTPYSIRRDQEIEKICQKNGMPCIITDDLMLNNPESILTGNNTPYAVFTAYYKNASKNQVNEPQKLESGSFYTKNIPLENAHIIAELSQIKNPSVALHGGSSEAHKLFERLKQLDDYANQRDFPAEEKTSFLSAHNKFGTVSIRTVYHTIGKKLGYHHPLIRQLYWRDFFTQVAYFSPYVFGHAFHKKFEHIRWYNDTRKFELWCEGKTGFPIVDAGMRQLNATGFMHNRARLITASFLVKDLHIDWKWGEQYFAQNLVDYDPAVNNGNWQWCASTGCDSQPYFRIFNPWLQQRKFDPECVYIKRWIPELKSLSPQIIHTWHMPKHPSLKNYPKPIVDHKTATTVTKKLYQTAR